MLEPFFQNEYGTLYNGDALAVLRELPDCSVNCCVTSPPYWGLRDYGVDGQIGLEETPEQYVSKMVEVFREIRRVLRDDGTLWINMGDTYNSTPKGSTVAYDGTDGLFNRKERRYGEVEKPLLPGLKPKDLIGIPWRVAFALQADGWWLRSDIIWHKPNPMPESVRDRPTKSHEDIFLLSKNARYYYDAEAIREPIAESTARDSRLYRDDYETGRPERGYPGGASHGSGLLKPKSRRDTFDRDGPVSEHVIPGQSYAQHRKRDSSMLPGKFKEDASKGVPLYAVAPNSTTRNKRDVWTVATAPFSEAHFATFPPALIEPCILAGCPKGGTVLDPFAGSGTTGLVCQKLGRLWVDIDLSEEYCKLHIRRVNGEIGQIEGQGTIFDQLREGT
jgi:DNA modification methylase